MMKKYIKCNLIMLVLVLLTACGKQEELESISQETQLQTEVTTTTEFQPQTEVTTATQAQTEVTTATQPQTEVTTAATVDAMSLEQKIYQLFVVTPEQLTKTGTVTQATDTTRTSLAKYPVGGIIYMEPNLLNPNQTKQMIANMQQYAMEVEGLPLFICVDEEGGRVARIANNSQFGVDNVGPMSEIKSVQQAYNSGQHIGEYLKELGFNVDFAPDADVITNSQNTVIGNRSFGSDADIVTDYAVAYSKGLREKGIMSTFKHFPGHGGTLADTHAGYAYTDKTYGELLEAELKPFIAAAKNNVDFIMAAHISVPNVIGNDVPCSLSHDMLTLKLRNEIGYNGLIITDALAMGAIAQKYSSAEAAVLSLKAGADVLLMPKDLEEAYTGISEAVKNGEISESRINDSVNRILKAKYSIKK